MLVTIVGPNLRDQRHGQFIVHRADCGDLPRLARKEPEVANGWTIDVNSFEDIVTAVYDDIMAEQEPDDVYATWQPYLEEFHICPCVQLPKEVTD